MRVNYRPGTWNALVREGALLVLPGTTDAALIADAWDGVDGISDLGRLVDLLTSRSGGSLSALPDFAAVVVEADVVRVAVRGLPEVVVETSEGRTRVSGAEVSTWSERLVRGATSVEITAEDAGGAADPGLPLLGGVVRVSSLAVDTTGASAAARVEGAVASASVSAPSSSPAPSASAPAESAPAESASDDDVSAAGLGGVSLGALAGAAAVAPAVVPAAPIGLPADAPAETASDLETPAETYAAPEDTILPEPEPDPEPESEPEPDLTDTLMPEDVASTEEVDEFDLLFGQTIHRPAADAPDEAVVDPTLAGDHDGATISSAEARALRREAPVSPEAPTIALPVFGGTGRIRVSTGQVVTLDRTVIIGRRPRSTRASGASLPHLIAVESPQQDISRSHLEVRPEGDTVVVIDLHTTNGSTLLRSGADPVRLHPGEQTVVVSGDVVDLGDGVTVAFEDLP
ncbi:FHA domain-containing protein [Microbacterium sp. LMX7-1.2]|uniref:FHA domain-containing protein n=1 Tax=Microbacterium sp. LMX7-1.2 TaxID=3135252 RepID=UPI0034296D3A